MYFPVQYEKTQEKPKLFEKNLEKTQGSQTKTQEPKIGSKNPRSWEKPKGWQRCFFISICFKISFVGWFQHH